MDFEQREKFFKQIFKGQDLPLETRMHAIGKLLTDLYTRQGTKSCPCECP